MKRLSIAAVALSLLVAACSDKSTAPTGPTTTTNVFTATLLPANEVPPITNAESSGTGTVTITMLSTKDASGNVTGATASFAVSLSGFPAGTPINLAHIHPGVAGVNGSPLVNLGLASGEVVLNASGAGTFNKPSIGVDAATAQQIINTPAAYYFNVHSTLNPGGVARGQLVKTQ
jgi:hypothetical protein